MGSFKLMKFGFQEFSIKNFSNVILCFQKKFVAIILVLSVFLCDFLLDPIGFSSRETGSAPFNSLASKYAIHRNCFGDLYLWWVATDEANRSPVL